MATSLDFIEQMRQKYGSGSSGPVLHAVSPTPQRYGMNPDDFAVPDNQASEPSGIRYTGRGSTGEVNPRAPAGIVHEGEMVVENPMVNRLGGPEKARKMMETAAATGGMPGYEMGTGSKTAGMRGYQTGTGTKTTDNAIPELPDPTKRETSEYSGITKSAISGIQDIASGKNKAAETAEAAAMTKTAGMQAARSASLQQNLAQSGVEGGAARVAQAMERRQAGEEQAGIRSAVAVEKAKEAQTAQGQLADIGMRGEQMEEAKHEFDISTQTAQKQWGASFAASQKQVDWQNNRTIAGDQIAAGDFEGAAQTYGKMGVTLDTTTLKDNATRQKVTNAMDDFTSFSATFGADSPQAQGALENLYDIQHPPVAGEKVDPTAKAKWVQDTAHNYEINTSPYKHALSEAFPTGTNGSLTPEGIRNVSMFAGAYGIPQDKIANFEFAGGKGAQAIQNLFTAELLRPGTLDDKNSSAYKALESVRSGGKGESTTDTTSTTFAGGTARKGVFKNADFDDMIAGDTVTHGTKTYYLPTIGGEPVEISGTVTQDDPGSASIADNGALRVDGKWKTPSVGQTFDVKDAIADVNYKGMTPGKYKVISTSPKVIYRNVDDPTKVYPTNTAEYAKTIPV